MMKRRWCFRDAVQAVGSSFSRVLTPLAIGGALLLVGWIVFRNWDELSTFQWKVNYSAALCSFLLCIGTWLLMGVNWGVISRDLGSQLDLRESMHLYFLSSVTQFVPGRVWYIPSRLYLYERKGVDKVVTSFSLIMEMVAMILSGVLVYALTSIFFPADWLPEKWRLLPVLFVPVVIFFAYPSHLVSAVNFSLTKMGREKVSLKLDYKKTLKWLALYSLNWLIGGGVFYYLLRSIWPLPGSHFPEVLQSFCLSNLISQVLFFIPAGLGAREVSFVYLLSSYVPSAVIVLGSLVLRIWLILGEVVCLGLFSEQKWFWKIHSALAEHK